MPMYDDQPRSSLPAVLAVVGVIALVGLGSLLFLGGQTSTILSTVGSSVTTGTDTAAPPEGDATAGSDIARAEAVVDVSRPDLLVIRTGTIVLQVADVERAVSDAGRDIQAVGGYVSASEQSGHGSDLTATITYRIPVDAWEGAIGGHRASATSVVAAETHTEDVTAQVVDLDARIMNLRVTEEALQAIMATATKTSDILDVQEELTTVRGDIEVALAQVQRLEDQAAFSTLTATFRLKPVAAVVAIQTGFDPQSEVDQATARLVRVVQKAITAGIWFGIVWLPILLVGGIAAGILALIAIRVRRVLASREPVPNPPS